jgi:hypothetical protein
VDDSLRRDDMRPFRPAPVQRRARVLWQILFGGARVASYRLYPRVRAQRIAARFNRLYRVDVAYVDCCKVML